MHEGSAGRWSEETFGNTVLGDVRRTRRLVAMARVAAMRPSGKVSAVFDRARDREGAYDFLENPHVKPKALAESVFAATVARARGIGDEYVYVAIDGSTLSLPDYKGAKGFGPVGTPKWSACGLKVMNALAVARDGVPLGLVDQIFWSRRPTQEELTRAQRTRRNQKRAFEEKEPWYFVAGAKNAIQRLECEGLRAWVVIDREGDDRNILLGLHRAGCVFTVRGGRGNWDRRLWPNGEQSVREMLDSEPSLGTYEVKVGRTGRRAARTAMMDVRAAQVVLRFPPRGAMKTEALRLYAVLVREIDEGKDALDWLLYTNAPVLTSEHAQRVIASYQARWRVEEFHRTWKQGECNVEDAQLRSQDAVVKWATLLSAVATRIERLKYLSRSEPNAPASCELAAEEIEALKLDRRRRTRRRPPRMPSIGDATRWIAELGGWIGSRNGPPGSVTLARGLERLGYLVEGIALARPPTKGLRRT
jgi:hypothetical protein